MFSPPSLLASDYYGPAIAASCSALFMSRVAEPARRTFNAILVAGSCGAYLNRGFGPWELAYPLLATPVVYAGLRSYTFIGIAWLMHAARTWRTICGAILFAIHADLFLGVLGLRRNHRDLVPCRCACASRTWN